MVIPVSNPSIATSVDKKVLILLCGVQDFLFIWLWPNSPTSASIAFPPRPHTLFSTHTGYLLPSLCLYTWLHCLLPGPLGRELPFKIQFKHPKAISFQFCLPNATLLVPHRYLAQISSAVLQWQNKQLPFCKTVSSCISHWTRFTKPSTNWGPCETSVNKTVCTWTVTYISWPKPEWRWDSKGKVHSSKVVTF